MSSDGPPRSPDATASRSGVAAPVAWGIGVEGFRVLGAYEWECFRLTHSLAGPFEIPEQVVAVDTIAINVGPEITTETRVEQRGWMKHRIPHLGVSVIPSGSVLAARHFDMHEMMALQIGPGFVPETLRGPEGHVRWRQAFACRDAVTAHIVPALAEAGRSGNPGGPLFAESLVTALTAHLAGANLQGPAIQATPALASPKLRRVLDYIDANLDGPLALRGLAGVVEMDQHRFGRAFREATGLSPHQYVMQARIERAKQMLKDPALSISEIAMALGFATPSHFSLTFRRLTNVTPRQFRDAP